MSNTPEGKIKRKLDRWIAKNMSNAFIYKCPGGMYGQAGMGDYILVYVGTPIMIEVKKDETCSPTALQLKRLKQFQKSGGISCALLGFQEHKLLKIKALCELRKLREELNTPNINGKKPKSDERNIWYRTKKKCEDPNFSGFEAYGAKGIKFCDRWQDFNSFYEDLGPRPTLLHTLDRIDYNGDYEPSNCRWATKETQANNKATVKMIEYNGKTASLSEHARDAGLDPGLVICRINRYGWTLERALTEIPKDSVKLYTYKGVTGSAYKLCKLFSDLNRSTVIARLNEGWNIEDALERPLNEGR